MPNIRTYMDLIKVSADIYDKRRFYLVFSVGAEILDSI